MISMAWIVVSRQHGTSDRGIGFHPKRRADGLRVAAESDPGVFTELITEMGVRGVQVHCPLSAADSEPDDEADPVPPMPCQSYETLAEYLQFMHCRWKSCGP